MSKITLAPVAIAASLLMAAPAFAQSNTATTPSTTAVPNTAMHTTTNSMASRPNTPSNRNPVLADNGEARASKIIGSSVYNDQNTKIGSVDDILIGKNDQLQAVLSVGGFLGMGSKYVEVPYSNLKFGNTTANSDNRVVMPGATKDSLMSMSSFKFTNS